MISWRKDEMGNWRALGSIEKHSLGFVQAGPSAEHILSSPVSADGAAGLIPHGLRPDTTDLDITGINWYLNGPTTLSSLFIDQSYRVYDGSYGQDGALFLNGYVCAVQGSVILAGTMGGAAKLLGPGTLVAEGSTDIESAFVAARLLLEATTTISLLTLDQGGLLENRGALTVQGTIGCPTGGDTIIRNDAAGVVDFYNGQILGAATDKSTFVNAGLVESIGPEIAFIDAPFINSGTVRVLEGGLRFADSFQSTGHVEIEAGELDLLSGGSIAVGDFSIASGAKLVLGGGNQTQTFTLTGGSASGPQSGEIDVINATLKVSAAGLLMNGNLSGAGTIDTAGIVRLEAGLSGTWTIAGGGQVIVYGSSTIYGTVEGRLVNHGTMDAELTLGQTGKLVNVGTMNVGYIAGSGGTFTNSGSLIFDGGAVGPR